LERVLIARIPTSLPDPVFRFGNWFVKRKLFHIPSDARAFIGLNFLFKEKSITGVRPAKATKSFHASFLMGGAESSALSNIEIGVAEFVRIQKSVEMLEQAGTLRCLTTSATIPNPIIEPCPSTSSYFTGGGRTTLVFLLFGLMVLVSLLPYPVRAEEPTRSIPNLSISEFVPVPQAKLPRTDIQQAKFPVVDVHTHFFVRFHHEPESLRAYVQVMDRNNIALSVSLDGTLGPRLDAHLAYLWTEYRDRFVVFSNIDWEGNQESRPASLSPGSPTRRETESAPISSSTATTLALDEPGFVQTTIEQLRFAKSKGVSGLKIFKQLGLVYRHSDGSFVAIDDPRWDPIWQACGKLGLPVIMHTADPNAFFEPIDARNERYEELSRRPEWSFYNLGTPTRSELHEARNRVIARHPNTTFIAAHFGNDAEDLAETAKWLDTYPNLVVEFASRISELGRQPRTARKFFEAYQDRIMLGTDGPFPEERLRAYWRFLETPDEYFPYSEKSPPPQGLWSISGMELPETILRKVYFENACRYIPGVQEKYDAFTKK
jgi:predicted TIM-barrel fold metal-dependent hydrolase